MKNSLNTIMTFLILVVLVAGAYYIVQTLREGAQAATAPFQQVNEANQALQTQVAQMMHPTPTIIPDPVTYINEIRAVARLETIQYSVSQVVTAEANQGTLGFLFGNKILVQIHGTVIAGIDMEKIQPGDLRFDGNVLYVRLPPAEVFVTSLDESKTEVYNVQEGVFADVDPNMVVNALAAGKEKILNSALEDGILTQAQSNGEAYLLKFFNALGYKSVIFEH